jgi:hypothetical protein
VEDGAQGVAEDSPQNTVILSLHSYLTWDDYSAYKHSECYAQVLGVVEVVLCQ